MTEVYWYVGKITYELSENSTKASYGKKIIDVLSVKLTNEFGSGFSPVSIRKCVDFMNITQYGRQCRPNCLGHIFKN